MKTGVTPERVRRLLSFFGVKVERRFYQAKGKKAAGYKGGRTYTAAGYVDIYLEDDDPYRSMAGKNGYAKEHRVVMARKLGRPLTRSETVHHKNGVKDDNRPENLQIRLGNHGKGAVLQCRNCGSHDIEALPLI